MPIYEYRCSQCGHELEALQKLSEARLTVCPACHASTLVKQMSAAGFQLKGSGWYATDFRGGNKAKSPDSGENANSDAKSEAKPDAKSDSKSESKSDSKPAGDSAAEKPKSDTKSSPDKPASAPAAPAAER